MNDPLSNISTRRTPQMEQAEPREVRNSAGGYVYETSRLDRLVRFLTLGVEGGTYYVGEKDLARDNAQVVIDFARDNPRLLIDTIVDVSLAGRAPKQQPTIFALAIAVSLSDDENRKRALSVLPKVCRTGFQLFTFARYVRQFRGWGRGLRGAIGDWYLDKDVSELGYQMVKYRQRDGWTHKDLLRLSHGHVHAKRATGKLTEDRRALFDWACGREVDLSGRDDLERVAGFEAAQTASVRAIPGLVRKYGLTWEMIPDSALNDVQVWEALIDVGVPQTALLRQLPRLTRLNMLHPMGDNLHRVVEQLTDRDRLRKARIHPIQLLIALRTYASGVSARGAGRWEPVGQVVDALDEAFYRSFDLIEPTGKRFILALDVSGSMGFTTVDRVGLTPREISAAMCMATARTERTYEVVGFTGGYSHSSLSHLPITPRQRLDDVVNTVSNLPFGPTDCALPILYAKTNKIPVDCFVVYTDNETWQGSIHVDQALKQYRESMGIAARMVVVGMTSTGFTIADPADPLCLDVAGFDASVPSLINNFARGDI